LGMDLTYYVTMTIQIDSRDGRYRARVSNVVIETEDANKIKNFINVEQLMNSLLGKENVPGFSSVNPFNKSQSKRALQSLNILVDKVMVSINQTMNDRDDF
jgi:hypothetical protein